jgi:hypothetical protein
MLVNAIITLMRVAITHCVYESLLCVLKSQSWVLWSHSCVSKSQCVCKLHSSCINHTCECQFHTHTCQTYSRVCRNHTQRVKSHSPCWNHIRACINYTSECHNHTHVSKSWVSYAHAYVSKLLSCEWKPHSAYKITLCVLKLITLVRVGITFLLVEITLRIEITLYV